jgi:hypothetical protein
VACEKGGTYLHVMSLKNEELTSYNKHKTHFLSNLDLNLTNKLVKSCTLRIAVYGVEM